MARYSLILRDSDFVLLVAQAQESKLSFGKYVNIVLHKVACEGVKPEDRSCFFCGNPPDVQVRNHAGDLHYLCVHHSSLKKFFITSKPLEVKE